MFHVLELPEVIDRNLAARSDKGCKDSEQTPALVLMQLVGGKAPEHLSLFREKFSLQDCPIRIPSPTSTRSCAAFNTYCPKHDILVGTQFRDGNVHPGWEQLKQLKKVLANMPAGVEKVSLRSDSAGYQVELLKETFPEGVKKTEPTGQEWAEVVYVPNSLVHSRKAPQCRRAQKNPEESLPGRSTHIASDLEGHYFAALQYDIIPKPLLIPLKYFIVTDLPFIQVGTYEYRRFKTFRNHFFDSINHCLIHKKTSRNARGRTDVASNALYFYCRIAGGTLVVQNDIR